MHSQFDVSLTDRDYYEFNEFYMLRSHYGKSGIITLRVVFAVVVVVLALMSLARGAYSAPAFLGVIPYAFLLVLLQIGIAPVMRLTLKLQLKDMKKKGKMAFSPESHMEFFDDRFTESTPENKTEQKYSAIERISVREGIAIYIHVNNVMAYLLPVACFESKEQYDDFLEFLKSKCQTVDFYNR